MAMHHAADGRMFDLPAAMAHRFPADSADTLDPFDPTALAAQFKSAVMSIAALLLVLALIVFL